MHCCLGLRDQKNTTEIRRNKEKIKKIKKRQKAAKRLLGFENTYGIVNWSRRSSVIHIWRGAVAHLVLQADSSSPDG